VTKKRPGPKVPIAQFIAVIALSISIFLVIDFGRRAAANYRVQREAQRLSQEVEAVSQQQAQLLAWRSYVASDLYVEDVARKELRLARPGETVVIVMPTPEAVAVMTTTEVAAEVTAPIIQTPAEAWWHLFFGPQVSQVGSE
jgi:cell division protein FtsB